MLKFVKLVMRIIYAMHYNLYEAISEKNITQRKPFIKNSFVIFYLKTQFIEPT